jgi:hypothetical protein
MVGLLRHSQRKRGGNGLARPTATALRLDSTEVFVRNRLGIGGIEVGGLVEVVGEESLGDLVVFPTPGPHGELGLGWAPGGMEEWGRGGLADVGQDSGDGLGVGKEGDERERGLAGGADQGENFIDPGQEGGPPGGPGGGDAGWLGWCRL